MSSSADNKQVIGQKTQLSRLEKVRALRDILDSSPHKPGSKKLCVTMPCCYDGLSAKMIDQAGSFPVTFMSGFSVAASHGVPDCQLLGLEEMASAARICNSVLKRTPLIGDADTGYGNALNVKRTVSRYRDAGCAGIMIEDQISPKRCGHTKGKLVEGRAEAFARVKAAVDARDEGEDIVILARTDARATHGLEEAIFRCCEFMKLGADWTFLEAPESVEEMREYGRRVPGPKLANMIEFGKTPILSAQELSSIGYSIAAFPLTLLSANVLAMSNALERLRSHQESESTKDASSAIENEGQIVHFGKLREVVGFEDYYTEFDKYTDVSKTYA